MRILDTYILRSFLYNFISSFGILMLIFIFQTIWLFIDDLAGRGLDIVIIGKFLFYIMPSLMEKVLPLTVLLASILTFGKIAENYEFAAMKASGISLQRAMLSLIVFVVFLSVVVFYFANNVIPAAELKIYSLRKNIGQLKPSTAIIAGAFSDLEGTDMNMKVDRKYGDNDRFLENVIIHRKSPNGVNNTVIKAKTGELISGEGSNILQLVLKDGNYYEDVEKKKSSDNKKFPFAKSSFKKYIINQDISKLDVDLEKERDVTTDKMKNVSRLVKDIDSIKISNIKIVNTFSKSINKRIGAFPTLSSADSILQNDINNLSKDSVQFRTKMMDTLSVLNLYKGYQREQILNSSKNTITNILATVSSKKNELDKRFKIYNMHIISLHKKFALALSCIILFFVGAPLGAIIRKGGLGLPMVIAIILFLIYYFIGVFAENSSKEGSLNPVVGAWMSTFIMLPLGVFLTKRATADRGLSNFGSVIDFFKKLFAFKKNKTATE
ncbi:LptF/LptG family permease [Cellulophaga baltica]|uniref:LptF/LptG family permease n=1 Tax=Cellulophaga TaxID=104264 RepID=UPI001C068A85|nr:MULTISPECIES: LptF/LptG family permease [Cellulophaga]MBU2997549.1 LptF/LptG family permease [Cellulophaga baltica]MDO6768944.1 LptF/LptG family permease [Cellulophaga sp. 1_MG-2023]